MPDEWSDLRRPLGLLSADQLGLRLRVFSSWAAGEETRHSKAAEAERKEFAKESVSFRSSLEMKHSRFILFAKIDKCVAHALYMRSTI